MMIYCALYQFYIQDIGLHRDVMKIKRNKYAFEETFQRVIEINPKAKIEVHLLKDKMK